VTLKRFTARTSRDALSLVRASLGAEAVVLSTKPCAEGVEVLAMAPEALSQIEQAATAVPAETAPVAPIEQDVNRLAMSTLSFQDYVRERLLRRRRAAMQQPDVPQSATVPAATPRNAAAAAVGSVAVARPQPQPMAAAAPVRHETPRVHTAIAEPSVLPAQAASSAAFAVPTPMAPPVFTSLPVAMPPVLHDTAHSATPAAQGAGHAMAQPMATSMHEAGLRLPDPMPSLADAASGQRERAEVMNELRSVRGLIEERFSALAFMEQMQRHPRQASLSQRLLDAGFSPALIRKLVEHLPSQTNDEMAWAGSVLQRNLLTDEGGPVLEDVGGVYALIGATGVGKTTSTAKIAAAFATRYGAAHLGLITLDAYRMAAHEQLRAYGRILGVPVHTAHDRASLDDLLELLSGKKLVLIDTAGMAQRDERTAELLEMLSHRMIQRILVLNAGAQGETVEDVMQGYAANRCRGAIVSKIDEAAKIAPTLDALIRHKLRVLGVANGQRVPEDFHRLSSAALIERALRALPNPAWRVEPSEINLVFAAQNRGACAPLHA
jgi:flagellar biosynthesis protein FlhF